MDALMNNYKYALNQITLQRNSNEISREQYNMLIKELDAAMDIALDIKHEN